MSDDVSTRFEPLRLDIEGAQAEIEMLEAGRPKPSPRNEIKPPPTARAAQMEAERQREIRLSEFYAFVEANCEDYQPVEEHYLCDELDMRL